MSALTATPLRLDARSGRPIRVIAVRMRHSDAHTRLFESQLTESMHDDDARRAEALGSF
jgi:hypothetical protein